MKGNNEQMFSSYGRVCSPAAVLESEEVTDVNSDLSVIPNVLHIGNMLLQNPK